jgi:hypothetical protein
MPRPWHGRADSVEKGRAVVEKPELDISKIQ